MAMICQWGTDIDRRWLSILIIIRFVDWFNRYLPTIWWHTERKPKVLSTKNPSTRVKDHLLVLSLIREENKQKTFVIKCGCREKVGFLGSCESLTVFLLPGRLRWHVRVFHDSLLKLSNPVSECSGMAGRGARGCQREGTDLIAHCHSSRRGGRPFLLKSLPTNNNARGFFSYPETCIYYK